MVSAAGLAPAVPRFQAEHVAATPRAVRPDGVRDRGRERRRTEPWLQLRDEIPKIGAPGGSGLPKPCKSGARMKRSLSRIAVHPHSSRRQRVAFLFSYESKMACRAEAFGKVGGKCW